MIMKRTAILLGFVLAVAACTPEEPKPAPQASDPEKAPVVVSTEPEANAPDAEVVTEIVVTYDRDILLAPNTTISVNGIYCDDDVYVVGKQLFIPFPVRGGGNTYTVKVTSPSVKDADGNYCADFSFSFTTVVRNNFDAAAFVLADAPVDPAATSEAKALYAAMKENFGDKSYSAAMAQVDWNYDNAKAIQQMTGKYPAINAFDYIHLPTAGAGEWIDYGDITPVKEWADMGGIVAASWHWMVPVEDPREPEPTFNDDEVFDFDDVVLGAWDTWAYLEASCFANTQVGSELKVYYKGAADAQLGLKNNISGWPGIVDGNGTSYEYIDIPDGKGFYSLTVDAEILSILQGVGLVITGRYVTLLAVGINHPGSVSYNEEKWEIDDIDCGNWAAYKYYPAGTFSTLTAGSKLTVHYKNASGAQMAFKTDVAGWPGIVDGNGNDFSYFNIPDGEGDYTLNVDETVLATLQASGLIIGGHDYTIDYVIVAIPAGAPQDIVLDCENIECGNWAAYKYFEPSYFTSIAAGDQFIVHYKDASGAQMGLKDPGQSGWPGLVDGNGNDYSYFVIPDGEGDYTLNIDQKLCDAIQAGGIVIGGHDYTIVTLTIRKSAASTSSLRPVIVRPAEAELKEVAYSFSSEGNAFNPVDALTEGHWQNDILKADLDKMVANLKLLQDKNIPVLFRPLHEASGKWFWWGSKSGADFVALWQYVYKYITDAGVHNLLWVWTSCLNDADWYPGDAYVDFIAYDWYPQDAALYHTSGKEAWDALLSISNKKMLTLGECGAMPAINECLEDGVMWSWWMPWYGEFMAEPYNDAAMFKSWMAASHVITQ